MGVGGEGPLLQREEELETIAGALGGACAGAGSLTVIEGPAGIGKTRLLDAAAELAAEREMKILRARGGVLETQIAYGVVRQLLEREVLAATTAEREQLLRGPTAAAAAVLGLGEPPQDGGPGHDPSPEILHALHWVTVNLAEVEPLLVMLDDAHWSDAASLRAGGYLARRLDGVRLAMLVATRDDEPDSQGPLLAELFAQADPTYLHPAPFSAASIGTILSHAFGGERPPPELVEACVQVSGGNAFFVTELAGELAAAQARPGDIDPASVGRAGPLSVRRSLLLRLGRLGKDARALAQAVATLGGEAEPRHAAAIADLDAAEAARAADLLARAGILAGDRPLRMIHPLVQAAVDDEMTGSARTAAHRRAFEVLQADAAPEDARLAHALLAEPAGDPELVALLRAAAGAATRTGSPQSAAAQLRRALAEPPPPSERAELLAELGRAEVRGGAFAEGLVCLDQALEAMPDPGGRAAIHRDRAFAAFASAGMDEARRVVHAALAELGEGGEALQLEAELALLAWLSGGDHALDLDRHRRVTGSTPAERTILALLAQSDHARGSDPDGVIALAERALAGGRLVEEDTSESLAWYMAIYALLTCEAHAAARETIEHALRDAHRRGSVFARAGALGTRAVLALNEGRPRDAEADARTAAAGAIPPIMQPVNSAYIVLALVDQGDLETAGAELRAAGLEHGPGGPTVLRWIPWARARLYEAEGHVDGVRAAVEPLEDDDREGRPMRALAWRALLARTLARGADPARARVLAGEHLGWARSWGRPCALGVALRAAALASPAEARADGLRAAVEELAASSLRTEEARARADLGVALLRAGARREGRAELEPALEVAIACGARGTAEAVAKELEVAGAPPRRLRFDELTASERRVAELVAEGATNREVAEQLFVTPKTVENHLTRVYAKLGIDSRRELAQAL